MSQSLPHAILDIVQNEQDPLRAFLRLAGIYRAATPGQRAAIGAGWPFGRDWSVPGLDYSDMDRVIFAPLVGEDADGLDAQARIKTRLTCHVITYEKDSFREMLTDFCLCYHSGLRAGIDVVSLFGEAAKISSDEVADLLRGFLQREPENKSLWAFGFCEELIENGIAFKWIGFDKDYDALKPARLDSMGRVAEDVLAFGAGWGVLQE